MGARAPARVAFPSPLPSPSDLHAAARRRPGTGAPLCVSPLPSPSHGRRCLLAHDLLVDGAAGTWDRRQHATISELKNRLRNRLDLIPVHLASAGPDPHPIPCPDLSIRSSLLSTPNPPSSLFSTPDPAASARLAVASEQRRSRSAGVAAIERSAAGGWQLLHPHCRPPSSPRRRPSLRRASTAREVLRCPREPAEPQLATDADPVAAAPGLHNRSRRATSGSGVLPDLVAPSTSTSVARPSTTSPLHDGRPRADPRRRPDPWRRPLHDGCPRADPRWRPDPWRRDPRQPDQGNPRLRDPRQPDLQRPTILKDHKKLYRGTQKFQKLNVEE
ncbi:hypothetical protein EJB05_49346, partial [Eragrostis curvula]